MRLPDAKTTPPTCLKKQGPRRGVGGFVSHHQENRLLRAHATTDISKSSNNARLTSLGSPPSPSSGTLYSYTAAGQNLCSGPSYFG